MPLRNLLVPEAYPQLVAGTLMIALAAWLVGLDPRSRVHRAFALYLVLRGVMNAVAALTFDLEAGDFGDFGGRVIPYFLLAVPFAALAFVVAYRERHGGAPRRPSPPWLLLLAALLVEAAYVQDHGLWLSEAGFGPLIVVDGLKNLSYALVAVLLARDALRLHAGPRRTSLLLVAVAFALDTAFMVTTGVLFLDVAGEPTPVAHWNDPTNHLVDTVALVPLAAMALLLARPARGRAEASLRRETRRCLVGLALPPASAVALLLVHAAGKDPARLFAAFEGLWTLTLPMLVGYALVRHELFGLDVRVHWTLKQSTVAAAFLAAFFVATEAAQALVSDRLGPLVGVAAAGVLVFTLAPLQRFAERVASAAMPGVKPFGEMSREERLALYGEQVRIAWEDGALTKKDRRLLEAARSRLGLTSEEALEVEREAAGA